MDDRLSRTPKQLSGGSLHPAISKTEKRVRRMKAKKG